MSRFSPTAWTKMLSLGGRMLTPGTRQFFCDQGPCDDVMSLVYVNEFQKPPSRIARATVNTGIMAFETKSLIVLYPRHALTGV
jgi:hypothetical protein